MTTTDGKQEQITHPDVAILTINGHDYYNYEVQLLSDKEEVAILTINGHDYY